MNPRARTGRFAALRLLSSASILAGGCLNPRPEEVPQNGPTASDPPGFLGSRPDPAAPGGSAAPPGPNVSPVPTAGEDNSPEQAGTDSDADAGAPDAGFETLPADTDTDTDTDPEAEIIDDRE